MRAEKKGERGAVTLDIGEIRKMEQAAITRLKNLAEGGATLLGRSETLRKRYDQTGTLRVNQHGGVEALKRIPIQDIKLMPGNHLYPDKVKEYQGRPDAPNPELRITPDGKFVVYDGNHRVEAARNRGDKDVLAWVSKPDGTTGYPSSEPVRYAYASTQVNLPKPLADKVLRAGKSLISDSDLAAHGRETEPHVTLKFGLHGEDPVVMQRLLENEPPIKVRLGKTSTFPDSGDGEVLKVDVDSPDLHRLNRKITDALPSTSTHAGYRPHVTLAYVRPGAGRKYVGSTVFAGQEVTIPTITFSDRSGRHHTIRLGGRAEPPRSEQPIDRRTGEAVPTMSYEHGDIVEIHTKDKGRVAIAQVSGRLRNHSVVVQTGGGSGKITFLPGTNQANYYEDIGGGGRAVYRNVRITKTGAQPEKRTYQPQEQPAAKDVDTETAKIPEDSEYGLEIEGVRLGNKPVHYGFYPETSGVYDRRPLLDAARKEGLRVEPAGGKSDYLIYRPGDPAGEESAKLIKHLVSEYRADPGKVDDPRWHHAFSKALGYSEELAKTVKSISGDPGLEAERLADLRYANEQARRRVEAMLAGEYQDGGKSRGRP